MVEVFSVRGRIALGDDLVPGAVIVRDGLIAEIRREPAGDLPDPIFETAIVAPGYIDIQVNGGWGLEIGSDLEVYRVLARRLPEHGVTGYLPTFVSAPRELYEPVLEAHRSTAGLEGARSYGLHLEGPLLSPLRKGAHRREFIEAADPYLFDPLLRFGSVRLVTLAPEREGALDTIRRLRRHDVVVALGHTDGSFDELLRGFDAGATLATHLFNAMTPFGHRAPGPIGAALLDDRVTAGLIADGIHVHPAAAEIAIRVKTPQRVVLVSDMVAAAGMPPGEYEVGGRLVRTDGVTSRLPDGTLAGALATIDECVRNVVAWTHMSPAAAIRMATEAPARLLGIPAAGRIVEGFNADLILLDDALHIHSTFIGGRLAYRRDA